jgi:hypothetical protein
MQIYLADARFFLLKFYLNARDKNLVLRLETTFLDGDKKKLIKPDFSLA